jgi:hypothetical protein
MRTVEIEIDGQITLAECMRMASSIGATLRGGPGGRLIITRVAPLWPAPPPPNVITLRGPKCVR